MKRYIMLIALLTLLFGQVSHTFAQGTTISSEVIARRCQRAQYYTNNDLKESDLRARVDRLQAYLYINQRLDLLAQRLENNSQPGAKELKSSLNDYLKAVDNFKLAYESYDGARNKLGQLTDCANKPKEFNQALNSMREQRKKVVVSIKAIQVELDKLRDQLAQLANQLKTQKGANS